MWQATPTLSEPSGVPPAPIVCARQFGKLQRYPARDAIAVLIFWEKSSRLLTAM